MLEHGDILTPQSSRVHKVIGDWEFSFVDQQPTTTPRREWSFVDLDAWLVQPVDTARRRYAPSLSTPRPCAPRTLGVPRELSHTSSFGGVHDDIDAHVPSELDEHFKQGAMELEISALSTCRELTTDLSLLSFDRQVSYGSTGASDEPEPEASVNAGDTEDCADSLADVQEHGMYCDSDNIIWDLPATDQSTIKVQSDFSEAEEDEGCNELRYLAELRQNKAQERRSREFHKEWSSTGIHGDRRRWPSRRRLCLRKASL